MTANFLPLERKGMRMVSKDFILDLAEHSTDISLFRKNILKSIEELSIVVQATNYCYDLDELKDFLKF